MKNPSAKAMIVAGVMSGTSADGVDVALCRISPPLREGDTPRVKVLGHRAFPYSAKLRAAVLAAMDAQHTTTAELSLLNWRLGEVYAECVAKTSTELSLKPQLVACHGQTIYHQGATADYLGSKLRATWQTGEASVIAERLRIPVISDFRPADLAAGGQAAPLVPMLDYCMFRHEKMNRILLNLGGIANLTAIPAGGGLGDVMAFDTGPANMVIDSLMQSEFNKAFDDRGRIAAKGRSDGSVVSKLMRKSPYFAEAPPKSCGREQFGSDFAKGLKLLCRRRSPADMVATATFLTVSTVLEAFGWFCWPHLRERAPHAKITEVIVTGGGAKNDTLMRMLADGFGSFHFPTVIVPTGESRMAPEAKEAAAFALLGWLTWHGLPGNVPSATGAKRPVVLGKVTYGA